MAKQKQTKFGLPLSAYPRPNASWLMLLGWCILCLSFTVITYASMQPVGAPSGEYHWDKLMHFMAYAVLTVGLVFAWPRRSLMIVFLLAFSLGVILEVLQGTIGIGRTASIWDAAANMTGILGVIGLWVFISPYMKHNPA